MRGTPWRHHLVCTACSNRRGGPRNCSGETLSVLPVGEQSWDTYDVAQPISEVASWISMPLLMTCGPH
jgi:hypothetical protein